MLVPSIAHLLYIPSVLIIGIGIGFVFGQRAGKDAEAAHKQAEEAKAARRAAREAARDKQA